jgi:predicted nucleic acid-binding protein
VRLYLDTSTLVKLHVQEEGSSLVRGAVERAALIATSALTYVEARAAFVRLRHEGGISAANYQRVVRDLDADWSHYLVVQVTDRLLRQGARLAEAHRLRAYDAVHLASAVAVKERIVEPVTFGCWDRGLERAASGEGLELLRDRR